MDEEYDAIVLGTGLKECILSGMLSVSGKKVLHMDRNKYYGGESASLSPLDKVFEHFDMPGNMDKEYGVSKNWNVDLIPKFLMANGQLVKLLIHTGVTRYLEFKSIEGSYFYKGEKIYKIPASESEAIRTSLMGIFEKRRYKNLLAYVLAFEKDDPSTWKKLKPEDTVEDLFKSSGVDKNTQDLTGHALALYRNEDYKQEEMWKFIAKMKLYCESLTRYGKSPYLYPLYGLGELPQAFARLSAIYGGTYMLNKSDIKIVCDENGEVSGVEAADEDKKKETAKTKMIVCDPTYALDKCQKVGQVVRAICILDHPIPDTDGSNSTQVIIPQNQVGRTHDIYISCVSNTNMVADKGYFLATASTTVETKEPEEELKTAFKVMGPILQKFVSISDLYEPKPTKNQLFITSSYDATSHFETTCTDVLSLFEKITGGPFDFSLVKNAEDIEQC